MKKWPKFIRTPDLGFDWDWRTGTGYHSLDDEVWRALIAVKRDGSSKNCIWNMIEPKWYKITILKYHWSCIDHSWRQMDYTFGSSRDKNMYWKIRISKLDFKIFRIQNSLKLLKSLKIGLPDLLKKWKKLLRNHTVSGSETAGPLIGGKCSWNWHKLVKFENFENFLTAKLRFEVPSWEHMTKMKSRFRWEI